MIRAECTFRSDIRIIIYEGFGAETIICYETIGSKRGWVARERFFVKVLINRPLRFDSTVFSFYILCVKGVARKSEASESERCFLAGDNNVAE